MGHALLDPGRRIQGDTHLTRLEPEDVMDLPLRAAVREGRLRVGHEASCGRPDKRRSLSPV